MRARGVGVAVAIGIVSWGSVASASAPEVLLRYQDRAGIQVARSTRGLWFFTRALDGTTAALGFTDGTAAGTKLVERPPTTRMYWVLGLGPSRAVFLAEGKLWGTDLTREGTRPIGPLFDMFEDRAAILDSVLVYRGTDAEHGTELWRTDGTAAGTFLLGDICPGPQSSQPRVLAMQGGHVYFGAWSCAPTGIAPNNYVLYRTDGTTIDVVGDLSPNGEAFGPGLGIVLDQGLVFTSRRHPGFDQVASFWFDGTTWSSVGSRETRPFDHASWAATYALGGRPFIHYRDASGVPRLASYETGELVVDAAVQPFGMVGGALVYSNDGGMFATRGVGAESLGLPPLPPGRVISPTEDPTPRSSFHFVGYRGAAVRIVDQVSDRPSPALAYARGYSAPCAHERLWITDATRAGTRALGLVDVASRGGGRQSTRVGGWFVTVGDTGLWVTDGVFAPRRALLGDNLWLNQAVGDRILMTRRAADGMRELIAWTPDLADLTEVDLEAECDAARDAGVPSTDGGSTDAGPKDAGPTDAGRDAGPSDAGSDAGSGSTRDAGDDDLSGADDLRFDAGHEEGAGSGDDAPGIPARAPSSDTPNDEGEPPVTCASAPAPKHASSSALVLLGLTSLAAWWRRRSTKDA